MLTNGNRTKTDANDKKHSINSAATIASNVCSKNNGSNTVAASCVNDNNSSSDYANRAFISFLDIMSGHQKNNSMEHLNRANKGELFVLQFLTMQSATVLPSELSAALQSSTARISALLGSLEKKGQIEREIDKNNRRNILVTITDAGRKRVESEMQEMQRNVTQVFIEMGESDTEEFIRLTKLFFDLSEKRLNCHKR